jgi:hypothetical protein
MEVIVKFYKANVNTVKYSGYFLVNEELAGDFEVVIEANRCSFDMKTCTKYTNFRIDQICEKFESKNPLYASVCATVSPPLHCPVKAGNYSMGSTVVDLSILNVLNFDGYIWLATVKFVTTNSTTKLKRVIMCYNTEIKMVKVRNRSG